MTRDPLDDAGSADPGLSALFGDLTSPATSDELAGQQAAMAMFAGASAVRAQTQDLGITQSPAPHRPRQRTAARGHSRRPRRRPVRVGGRLVAAAGVLALAFGFAAAGYAEVLPAPLQRVAYQILGFAGVPDSPHGAGSHLIPHPSGSGRASSHPTTVGSVTPSPGSPSSGGSPRRTRPASPRPKSHSPRSASPSPSSPGSPSPTPPGPRRGGSRSRRLRRGSSPATAS